MRLIAALSMFILTAMNVAIADDIPRDILPPCEDNGCYVIAEEISLKETIEIKGVRVRSRMFSVTIPSNVTGIDHLEKMNIYRYDTTPYIVAGTETDKDFKLSELTSKSISLSAFMDIIFTKTPKDLDQIGTYDKESWNRLMWFKNLFLQRPNKAFVYVKGKLKIYYIPNSGQPYNNIAWAIDSEHPDSALRLESNINEDDFRKMLFSISRRHSL